MRVFAFLAILVVIAPCLTAGEDLARGARVVDTGPGSGGILSFPTDTFTLVQEWKMGIFSNGIGRSGIIAHDLDDDGTVEIVSSGATVTFGMDDFWYVLRYDPLTLSYGMVWISQLYTVGITSIAAFDTDNDSIYSIFVGFSDGDILVYDGSTFSETGNINSGAAGVNRILLEDADNDAVDELIFCDAAAVFLYDAISLSFEHQIGYGANDFEVGNVDADPANEVVMASGEVLEFDGDTVIVEWDYAGGDFGYLLELSDIDSDGMKEVIGAEEWYYITAFDADIQSPKWQINASLDVAALLVVDVEADGADDIVYGDGQWGEIHCCDATSTNQKWEISNPEHGVTNIAVSDFDGDDDMEILWGAGATSTGEDHIFIHDIPTLAFEWASEHVDGPFHAIEVGDVDSDGDQELVIVSYESNSGYDDGVVFVFDAETHELEWQSGFDMFGGSAWTGVHDVAIGDVDDDTETEIVIATDELYDGAIYVVNGISHSIEGAYVYDDGAPIYSVEIADVDQDGQTEIIAGGGREHTGAPGVYVYVISGATGAVEWHSISLGDYWSEIYALEVGNVDGDTAPEIVATNDNSFIFDGITHQMFQSTLDQCYGLDLYDTDGDGVDEVVVGRDNGQVVAMDGETHIEEIILEPSAGRIDGIRVCDLDQSGNGELVLGSGDLLRVYAIADSGLIWESGRLGRSTGEHNSLVAADVDGDNRIEVIIGTNYTVVQFEGPQGPTAVRDKREDLPGGVHLLQNSPNPVRSSTTIAYALENPSHVRLDVYSANGQLIETLHDRMQQPGIHLAVWDAAGRSSGLYFYRLDTGAQSETKKCVVLK